MAIWVRPWPPTWLPPGGRWLPYVRRENQLAKLQDIGLRPTTDFGDLLDCELVISMLPDDDAVRHIVFGSKEDHPGGLTVVDAGAIHLSMSTISTACAAELAAAHAQGGHSYVAAPVFGNPDAAKARQLFIVAAGSPADLCAVSRFSTVLDRGLSWLAQTRRKQTWSNCSAT